MFELTGIGIGNRAVFGPVARMRPPLAEPPDEPRSEPETAARDRARGALRAVAEQLTALAGTAAAHAPSGPARSAVPGTHEAPAVLVDVLLAQVAMAEDPVLADDIDALIAGGKTAARAVFEAFGKYRAALAAAGPYLAARVVDLDDVRQRVIASCLRVAVPGIPDVGRPFVLVAGDLAPADTAALDLAKVLGFVTEAGGPTSHTAVLARARGIPAVVGCAGASALADGDEVLVDPARGAVTSNPDEHQVATMLAAVVHAQARRVGPGQTADGYPVALLANVGGPDDVAAAREAGAEGVGLYRTELLFLDADVAPGHRAQVTAYRGVFAGFDVDQRVVIRVLDAGADKPLAFLDLAPEANPALGVRGLRALRARPDILDGQLAAIAEAATDVAADIWVMAPMVADPAEAAWFAARATGHGLPMAGVMIEVPSAAMLAGEILDEVEFVSIGTNDLAQYALAVDRQAGGLAELQDPWHPGLLRLVALVGDAGAAHDRPVGVCGEAAADPALARVLVGLGVTSLSMAPAAIADVRDSLAAVTLSQCRGVAARVLATGTAAEARRAGVVAGPR
jgi:phosphotransferase system enzyme I (PtsI)